MSVNPENRNVQHTKKRYGAFVQCSLTLTFPPIYKADLGGSWTFSFLSLENQWTVWKNLQKMLSPDDIVFAEKLQDIQTAVRFWCPMFVKTQCQKQNAQLTIQRWF